MGNGIRTGNPCRSMASSKSIRVMLAAALALAIVPACAFSLARPAFAQSTATIEYIPEDEFTPEGCNWGANFTNVEVAKGFSAESDIARFYPRDYDELARPGDNGFAARIDGSTPKGSFALRYTGATRGDDRIDAVVTLADWTYVEPVMSNGESGWGEYEERDEYDVFQPGVFVNANYQRTTSLLENFNFYTVGLTDLKVEIEFFRAGTDEPYELKGHATCIDLDVGQKFGFGGATTLAQVVAGNDFLSIDRKNRLVTSPDYACGGVDDPHGAISADPADPLYKLGLVGAYFDTTGERRGEPCEFTFITSWHGSASTAQSFFAMTNEFLTAPNPNDDIDDIGKLEVRKTADKTEGVSLCDAVTYTVDVPVHQRGVTCRNGYSYTDFEIVDELPREMRYIEGSGYLADEDGQLIEGAGAVSCESGNAGERNIVKFAFSRDYLAQSMRMQGEHYLFSFKAALEEYPADGSLSLENHAFAQVNASGTYPSNPVETTLAAPQLTVGKSSDAYECEVGDIVHFTCTFAQTEKGAQCRGTTLSDTLPKGLQLLPETLRATGAKHIPAPSIEGNRWSYALDKLDFGSDVTVTYSAVALQSGNGLRQTNRAVARAANCPERSATAAIWENSAKLSVSKATDHYEHSIGASQADAGEVEYTVVVENTEEGTVANDVVISDATLPYGMRVACTATGEPDVKISGLPESVDYPCAERNGALDKTEPRAITCTTYARETGFEAAINHLPAGAPITLTYRCLPEKPLAGWEVENTACAWAENAASEQASALIWLNQPALRVEKTASLPSYTVGDLVTYHIKAINEAAGTIGRNLIIFDLMRTEGVELQRDSIRVWDSNGNDITDSCTISTNRDEPAFTVETHLPLVSDSDERTVWSFGERTAASNNPLGEAGETAVYVDYAVAITDAELAGGTVSNTAIAAVDEPNTETEGKADISIEGARLSLAKTSDAVSYRAGDTAHYTLSVVQTREGTTARNIVVEDAFEQEAAVAIDPDTIVLRDENGLAIEPSSLSTIENDDGDTTGFALQTGQNLADGETLSVSYDAKLKGASAQVVNRAEAKADNALRDSAKNTVEVLRALAEASITKAAGVESAQEGDAIPYSILVDDVSEGLDSAILRDSGLPEGAAIDYGTFLFTVNGEATEASFLNKEAQGFVLDLGNVPEGTAIAIEYEATLEDVLLAEERIGNTATISSPSLERDLSDSASVIAIELPAPKADAVITKTVSNDNPKIGDTVMFEITAVAQGGELQGVVITDSKMPEGAPIDFDSIRIAVNGQEADLPIEREGNGFRVFAETLASGDAISIAFPASIDDAALAGTKFSNRATFSSESLGDDRIAHATLSTHDDEAANPDPAPASPKAGGLLGKTGDDLMGMLCKTLCAIAVGALGIGTLAATRRKSASRKGPIQ